MFGSVTIAIATVCTGAAVYWLIIPLWTTVQRLRRRSRILSAAFPSSFAPKEFNWLLGNIPYLPGPNEEGLMKDIEDIKKCPRTELTYFGSLNPILGLHHPETVKCILKTTEPKAMGASAGYKFLIPWLGDGLLFSKGQKWHRNRRLLTPAFHFDILKNYVRIYNGCADTLGQVCEEAFVDGKSVEIFQAAARCTSEVILKCAFSMDEKLQSGKQSAYYQATRSLSSLFADRVFKPWLYPDCIYYVTPKGRKFKRCYEFSHSTCDSVIQKRRQTIGSGSDTMEDFKYKKRVDFLDILLMARDEDGNALSDTEIRDEVETFMFAGQDSTKSAMSFILYNLARHPEIQQRTRTEVQALLEGRESDEILWEDLSKMPYLTQCIKESLRLHPPIHTITRLTENELTIDGHTVPPETFIIVNIWGLHHNTSIWGEEVMTFDPERFSEENQAKMDPFQFIPFSAGPRNCIGQNFAMNEIKVVVAKTLKKFEISVDENVKVELAVDISLKTKDGIYLNFKPL